MSSSNDLPPDVISNYYRSLKSYLSEHLQREKISISQQRQSAREKLTKLAVHQFKELSTDVFDEMKRRQIENGAPNLPPQPEFHPKRNEARQKLATLSETRFKDLASDVFAELERRHPEMKSSREDVSVKPGKSGLGLNKDLPMAQPTVQPQLRLPGITGITQQQQQTKAVGDMPADTLVNFQTLDNLMADLGNMIVNDGLLPGTPTTQVRGTLAAKQDDSPLLAELEQAKKENERLQEELSRLNRENADVRNECDKQFAQMKSMKSEHEAEVLDLKALVDGLQLQIQEMNVEQYKSDIAQLESRLKQTEEERDLQVSQVQTLLDEKARFSRELDLARDDLTHFKDEILKLSQELETAKESAGKYVSEVDSANNKVHAQEQHIHKLEEQVLLLSEELAEVKERAASFAEHATSPMPQGTTLSDAPSLNRGSSQNVARSASQQSSPAYAKESDPSMSPSYGRSSQQELSPGYQDSLQRQTSSKYSEQDLNPVYDDNVQESSPSYQQESGKASPHNPYDKPEKSLSLNAVNQSQERQYNSAMQVPSQEAPVPPTINKAAASSSIKSRFEGPELYHQDGLFDGADITSYANGARDLVQSAENNEAANVLVAMKTIVIAARNLAERVERFENDPSQNKNNVDSVRMNELRSQLSTHLTDLMSLAKGFALSAAGTAAETVTVQQLDASVDQLTDDVYELTRMFKMKVDASDIINAVSPGEGSSPIPPVDPMEAKREEFIRSEVATSSPGYPYEELKAFLEQQTDLIVRNIQALLDLMRQSSFGNRFKDTIDGISTVVDNLVMVSRETLAGSNRGRQEKGNQIIQQLIDSNTLLNQLSATVLSNQEGQSPSKQRVAAAAYEVAKHTKALVGLFELEKSQ